MRTRFRWSIGLTAALLAATPVLVWLATPAEVVGQSAKRGASLELVPTEGFAVLTVNAAALHDAPVTLPIREAFLKGDRAFLKRAEADYGLTPDQLDRVTVFVPQSTYTLTDTPLVLITTRKPIDRAKVLAAWKATTEPPQGAAFCGGIGFGGGILGNAPFGVPVVPPGGGAIPVPAAPVPFQDVPGKPKGKKADKSLDLNAPLYYVGGPAESSVLVPVDDHTLAYLPNQGGGVASPLLVAALLRKRADGPLAEAVALADKHHLTAAVDGKHLREAFKLWREGPGEEMIGDPLAEEGKAQPPKPMKDPNAEDEFTPYEPLVQLDRAVLTVDVGEKTTARLVAHFPTAEAAVKAEAGAKVGLKAVVKLVADEQKGASDEDKDLLPVYDFALAGLEKAAVVVDGKTLTVTATADVGPALKAALTILPVKVQEAADRMKTANNLKQIGLAIHSYESAMGHLPQDLADADGKVLHSWRVQLLPYLEANDLYEKIDKSRAWDDPVNKKHWDKMPDVFRVAGREAAEKGYTFLQAFRTVNWVGTDDVWMVDNKKMTMAEITDGTSNTAAVVETEEAANWMKPGEILFDPKKLSKVGNPKTGRVNVLMMDASARTFDRKKLTGEKLKAILTANGGEDVNLDDGR
jgi:hypothetical protein